MARIVLALLLMTTLAAPAMALEDRTSGDMLVLGGSVDEGFDRHRPVCTSVFTCPQAPTECVARGVARLTYNLDTGVGRLAIACAGAPMLVPLTQCRATGDGHACHADSKTADGRGTVEWNTDGDGTWTYEEAGRVPRFLGYGGERSVNAFATGSV